jgi:predicted helicase
MPTDHRAELAKIRTFPSLVRYLRDEMDWPIQADDFDELTFEYSPEELGIDLTNAAKIQEIKRLRPLSPKQPWGIFFIKFEPKKLPVVALRRILSQVALKKRASANRAERAAWAADDLLFVSNYGVGDERRISFAHFSKSHDGHDLPTLKVLGWDNLDTALHLDAVARELIEHLAWPDDDTDEEAWRKRWRGAFTLRLHEVVTTSKELSIRLAELARAIRDRIKTALAIETESGPLTKLMKAFQEALVHDLDADGFADMYAQTIAYGLLSARIADPEKKTADDFASHMRTNPFLRELMETFLKVGGRRGKAGGPGIDFDELGVSEVVELLDDANMEAVVDDFGDRNPQEDPVIHFYELFLKEYDAKKRMQRGVFYTPRPVVSYIVRSIDELLRTEFGLNDGLADTASWGEMATRHKTLKIPEGSLASQAFVQILDPATGTGTFLVEVIDLVHRTMVAKWKVQGHGEKEIQTLWNEYVPSHLLPRLHGYELLMAPYAIAHLKIGLKLYETGYRFGSDERARVYLTNALEPAHDFSGKFEFVIPALAHEAQAVNKIKRDQHFTVVIGNPPYSVISQNTGAWITSLIELYKKDVREERNIQPLSDDYVKFLRLGQFLIEHSGTGILSLITNHTYLTGVIHRGLRRQLLASFDSINVLDLHGSALLGLRSPAGEVDQNVFDIQQGVAVAAFVRHNGRGAFDRLHRGDLWGLRQNKYRILSGELPLPKTACITPMEPFFFFEVATSADDAYKLGVSVATLFEQSSVGFVTGRDEALISFDIGTIVDLVKDLADKRVADSVIASRYGMEDTSGWPLTRRRRELMRDADRNEKVIRIAYRPFDNRFTFYGDFLQRARYSVFRHLLQENIALITSRLVKGEEPAHFFVTRLPTEKIFLSPKTSNNAFVFPLFSYPHHGEVKGLESRQVAVNSHHARRIAGILGLTWLECPNGNADLSLQPEQLLDYVYSILFSPIYRIRYAEFLKIDFPRIPLTSNLRLFRALTKLGGDLVVLHLMESPKLERSVSTYIGPRKPEVERVGWSNDTVWLDATATKKGQPAGPGTVGFRGVPEAVWNFHIGGYQVCEKWLKDRKGRTLSKDDLVHYQKIVVALAETIRLMKEIDEVIEAHGGWPGAFQQVRSTGATTPRVVEGPRSAHTLSN